MTQSRRLHFELLPTSILVGRALREAAIDRDGETSDSSHQYETAATYIFQMIGRYVEEAPRPINRYLYYLEQMGIAAANAEDWANGGADHYEALEGLFEVSVHQYLTCWCMVDRATKQLSKLFKSLRLDIPALHEPDIKKLFKDHTQIRDLFEHQDERFPITLTKSGAPLIVNTDSVGTIYVGVNYSNGLIVAEGASVEYAASGAMKLQEVAQRFEQSIREVCVNVIVNHTTGDGSPFVRMSPPWGIVKQSKNDGK